MLSWNMASVRRESRFALWCILSQDFPLIRSKRAQFLVEQ